MRWRTSHNVVYFLAGFTLMVTLTMVGLILIRPLLGHPPSMPVRYAAMYAPLITGIPFGLRVRRFGKAHGLKLGSALRSALGFGGRSANS
ncbi:MAG: hypothetical protein VX589_05985 [Myxococcota bacterium]|nr:hypothetical protein [Myxococcota bacterium]